MPGGRLLADVPVAEELLNRIVRRLHPEVKTLVWPNGSDFDPATLHDWPTHAQSLAARAKQWNLSPAYTMTGRSWAASGRGCALEAENERGANRICQRIFDLPRFSTHTGLASWEIQIPNQFSATTPQK